MGYFSDFENSKLKCI